MPRCDAVACTSTQRQWGWKGAAVGGVATVGRPPLGRHGRDQAGRRSAGVQAVWQAPAAARLRLHLVLLGPRHLLLNVLLSGGWQEGAFIAVPRHDDSPARGADCCSAAHNAPQSSPGHSWWLASISRVPTGKRCPAAAGRLACTAAGGGAPGGGRQAAAAGWACSGGRAGAAEQAFCTDLATRCNAVRGSRRTGDGDALGLQSGGLGGRFSRLMAIARSGTH